MPTFGRFIGVANEARKLVFSGVPKDFEDKVMDKIATICRAVCDEVGIQYSCEIINDIPSETQLGPKSRELFRDFLVWYGECCETLKKNWPARN